MEGFWGKIIRLLKRGSNIQEPVICHGCPYEINFNSAIKDLGARWQEVKEDSTAPMTGLYVLICKGDNHLLFEVHEYMKGEALWEPFKEANTHFDGWAVIKPVQYVILPPPDSKN